MEKPRIPHLFVEKLNARDGSPTDTENLLKADRPYYSLWLNFCKPVPHKWTFFDVNINTGHPLLHLAVPGTLVHCNMENVTYISQCCAYGYLPLGENSPINSVFCANSPVLKYSGALKS